MQPSIRIRPYAASDASALVGAALESVDEVEPWLPWCHRGFSQTEAADWLTAQVAAREHGSAYEFRIVEDHGDGDSGRFLGGVGINRVVPDHRFANLGYWVRSSATGLGVATRAVQQAIAFAKAQTELVRLEIVVAKGNDASARVAEKAGAEFEGVLRNRLFLHGKAIDAMMYAVAIDRPQS